MGTLRIGRTNLLDVCGAGDFEAADMNDAQATRQTGTGAWSLLRDFARAAWYSIRMPGKFHRGPLPPADERLMTLAEELRGHVTHLAGDIGERNVLQGPRALALTADYVESKLAGAGYEVGRQNYEVSSATCSNLEVEIPGTARADEIVVVGAHYDSVPGSPGANDNASGVAAILSLARRFAGLDVDRTLRFVAFVNEEAPYAHTEDMGSSVYARRCRARHENVTAMMCLETIGYYCDDSATQKYPAPLGLFYPSVGNFIAFVGSTCYGELVRQAVLAFRKNEPFPSLGGALPQAISSINRSDHWSFWQEGYPALMVTDTAPFRYPHYHTAQDTVDKVHFENTARVVRGLAHVVAALVSVSSDTG
jgi:Zn-dependent M28 family amino/carboxypeptidase